MKTEAALPLSTRVGVRISADTLWLVAVWAGTAVYALALSLETIGDHHAFRTGPDLASYDQLLWLLSHHHDAFSTVIARPMNADHFQPGLVLFTPIYWLGLNVPGILTAQAIGLGLAAPALMALARAAGASPAVASVPAFLWLTCPWVASFNLFEFHPLAFSPALIVVSVLAVFRERWWLLLATALLALSLKEDVAPMYLLLGVLIAVRGHRRIGIGLAAGSAVWGYVAHAVVTAEGGSYEAYGKRFAGDRGDTVRDAFSWMLSHPLSLLTDIAHQSVPGLFLLVLSTGCLALLAPAWMALCLPTALHNALSAYDPQHDLAHHYHHGTLTGLFVAAAIGAGRVHTLSRAGRTAVASLVGVAAIAAVLGGIWVHRLNDSFQLEREPTQELLDRIPPGVPVAAARTLIPHLTHRVDAYTLPEPFIPVDWGSPLTNGDLAQRAKRIRYVAYIKGDQIGTILTGRDVKLLPDVRPTLVREGFVVVGRAGPVVLFERR
jgi:uncharacterized membrane protein